MDESNKSPNRVPGDGGAGASPTKPKNWVHFTEEGENGAATLDGSDNVDDDDEYLGNRETGHHPAVIEPSIEIHSPSATNSTNHNSSNNKSINHPLSAASTTTRPDGTIIHTGQLQNVELQNSTDAIHKTTNNAYSSGSTSYNNGNRSNSGFTNGDVIVSILPVNTKWPWVTPASFRPELVPEELMVPGLTLTVEEYVHAMEILTSDFRFNAYTICYKRLLAAWLSTAFFILLIILFSGVVGIQLFALGISWLIINAVAVFLCMYIKIKINQGLERCMAKVNKLLIKHKLIIGLDDRGRISCHKVHLCFIYFDPNDCVKRLEQMLESSGGDRQRVQHHLDASDVEIVISGAQNTTRIPRKQRGETLFLRYVQRWAKDFLRRRLDWTVGEGGENPSAPRHLTSALCPCQYVEEYLRHKPVSQGEGNWTWWIPCIPQPQPTTS
ncbi:Transmembrane protein [Orchesella cincta]|uniref:Transmembrane protein n=1 Tax=Orchesella cincta TaxID=48709 RepID=A0A1D2NDN3_ORCCI|nr:Transmembrane protein [Orchesella cincta]